MAGSTTTIDTPLHTAHQQTKHRMINPTEFESIMRKQKSEQDSSRLDMDLLWNVLIVIVFVFVYQLILLFLFLSFFLYIYFIPLVDSI